MDEHTYMFQLKILYYIKDFSLDLKDFKSYNTLIRVKVCIFHTRSGKHLRQFINPFC